MNLAAHKQLCCVRKPIHRGSTPCHLSKLSSEPRDSLLQCHPLCSNPDAKSSFARALSAPLTTCAPHMLKSVKQDKSKSASSITTPSPSPANDLQQHVDKVSCYFYLWNFRTTMRWKACVKAQGRLDTLPDEKLISHIMREIKVIIICIAKSVYFELAQLFLQVTSYHHRTTDVYQHTLKGKLLCLFFQSLFLMMKENYMVLSSRCELFVDVIIASTMLRIGLEIELTTEHLVLCSQTREECWFCTLVIYRRTPNSDCSCVHSHKIPCTSDQASTQVVPYKKALSTTVVESKWFNQTCVYNLHGTILPNGLHIFGIWIFDKYQANNLWQRKIQESKVHILAVGS